MELSKMTMAQYVDMLCGELEVGSDERKRLAFEYASIADPAGSKSYVNAKRTECNYRSALLLFKVLKNLRAMKAYDEVRELLTEYGIRAKSLTDAETEREVDRRMKSAQADVDREQVEEEKSIEPSDIRTCYERQAASLMTYFKMQINMRDVSATAFAYMVAQANSEIKMRNAIGNR